MDHYYSFDDFYYNVSSIIDQAFLELSYPSLYLHYNKIALIIGQMAMGAAKHYWYLPHEKISFKNDLVVAHVLYVCVYVMGVQRSRLLDSIGKYQDLPPVFRYSCLTNSNVNLLEIEDMVYVRINIIVGYHNIFNL